MCVVLSGNKNTLPRTLAASEWQFRVWMPKRTPQNAHQWQKPKALSAALLLVLVVLQFWIHYSMRASAAWVSPYACSVSDLPMKIAKRWFNRPDPFQLYSSR